MSNRGSWMQVYTGGQFFPLDPLPEEVHILDIAHSLSKLCRYNGHCERFYSVAEHSVYVSLVVEERHALVALMHDAAEAYVADVPRPLKKHLIDHGWIEDGVWRAIARRFDLPETIPQAVWDADDSVLLAEAEQILKPHPAPWDVRGVPADIKIACLPPDQAASLFLSRFAALNFWEAIDGKAE